MLAYVPTAESAHRQIFAGCPTEICLGWRQTAADLLRCPFRDRGTASGGSMENQGTRDPIDRFFLVVVILLAIFLLVVGVAVFPH